MDIIVLAVPVQAKPHDKHAHSRSQHIQDLPTVYPRHQNQESQLLNTIPRSSGPSYPAETGRINVPPAQAQQRNIPKAAETRAPLNSKQVFLPGRASTGTHIHVTLLEAAYHSLMSTIQLLTLPNVMSHPPSMQMLINHHHQIMNLTQSSLQLLLPLQPLNQF